MRSIKKASPAFAPIVIVALNLAPVYGVLMLNWRSFDLIFLYWLENVLIGLLTFAGFFFLTVQWTSKLFTAAFFSVHYGMFCFVHGIFIVTLFGTGIQLSHPEQQLFYAAQQIIHDHRLYIAVFSLLALNVLFTIQDLLQAHAQRITVKRWMAAPYRRIIILHISILASGFILLHLNEPLVGLITLVLLKTVFDIYHHRATVGTSSALKKKPPHRGGSKTSEREESAG